MSSALFIVHNEEV
ncbi:Uncharacterized protein BM_BM546 [Brugia malayi]|nr:Uncharacterized protein BM_BM546 [Brugia malayi]